MGRAHLSEHLQTTAVIWILALPNISFRWLQQGFRHPLLYLRVLVLILHQYRNFQVWAVVVSHPDSRNTNCKYWPAVQAVATLFNVFNRQLDCLVPAHELYLVILLQQILYTFEDFISKTLCFSILGQKQHNPHDFSLNWADFSVTDSLCTWVSAVRVLCNFKLLPKKTDVNEKEQCPLLPRWEYFRCFAWRTDVAL